MDGHEKSEEYDVWACGADKSYTLNYQMKDICDKMLH